MTATKKIGQAAYQGPSVVKGIIIGVALGLMSGGLSPLEQPEEKQGFLWSAC